MMSIGIVGLTLVSTWLGVAFEELQNPVEPQMIVNGSDVEVCGWPTTVFVGAGCTGTLVHPRVVSTAQHCGIPGSVSFGETAGSGPSVGVVTCVGTGSQDAMLCELAEEIPLPVTPVLFGCEIDGYMQVGQDVIIAGFGQTSFNVGGGTKLWAPQTITAVEAGRTIIGNAGDGTSPCPGDSGGPVFVQVADGSWRVFGTVLSGTTGIPCNSAADFQRIDPVVPNFEMQTGIDITPCFDGQTGAWDPGPDCGGFFSGDHTAAGTWDDWCADAPATGYSAECGEPFGDDPGGSSGGGMGETGDESSDGGPSDGTGGSGGSGGIGTGGGVTTDTPGGTGAEGTGLDTNATGGDDDGAQGCGCRQGPSPRSAGAMLILAMLGLRRRRRAPRP